MPNRLKAVPPIYTNMTVSYPRCCECCNYSANTQQAWCNHTKTKKHQINARCVPCNNETIVKTTNKTINNNNIEKDNTLNQTILKLVEQNQFIMKSMAQQNAEHNHIVERLVEQNETQVEKLVEQMETQNAEHNKIVKKLVRQTDTQNATIQTQCDLIKKLMQNKTVRQSSSAQNLKKDREEIEEPANNENIPNLDDLFSAKPTGNDTRKYIQEKITKPKIQYRPIQLIKDKLYYKINNEFKTGNKEDIQKEINDVIYEALKAQRANKSQEMQEKKEDISEMNAGGNGERAMQYVNEYTYLMTFVKHINIFDSEKGLPDEKLTV